MKLSAGVVADDVSFGTTRVGCTVAVGDQDFRIAVWSMTPMIALFNPSAEAVADDVAFCRLSSPMQGDYCRIQVPPAAAHLLEQTGGYKAVKCESIGYTVAGGNQDFNSLSGASPSRSRCPGR